MDLYFPTVQFRYEFEFKEVMQKNGKTYLISYDKYSDTFGKIVEKYQNHGHQVIVIDYHSHLYSQEDIEKRRNHEICSTSSVPKKEGGSIFMTTLDAIEAGHYKDIPFMTIKEIWNMRSYLNEMQKNYVKNVNVFIKN